MKHRLILTYLLNLFDLYCTLVWVDLYGLSVESNPVGRLLISANFAIPFKTIGVGAAMLVLYAGVKRYPKWEWTSYLVLAVYAVLAVYHIVIASFVFY